MSDYVRKKVVRTTLGYKDKDRNFKSDYFSTRDKLEDYRDSLPYGKEFDVEGCIDYRTYTYYYNLDYELTNDYGEDAGDWGKTRAMSEKEIAKYKPLFEQACPNLVGKDFEMRVVEYCYYNCSEPTHYFAAIDDPFYDEV